MNPNILPKPESAFGMSFHELEVFNSTVTVVRQTKQRIERSIRGAIRTGYDGVDINYAELGSVGIESIEPWSYPEPDGANGFRTERYTWDWFSDDELTRLLTDDEFMQTLAGGIDG